MTCNTTATTVVQDCDAYDRIQLEFGQKSPTRTQGAIRFSGNYWPPRRDAQNRTINSMIFNDVEFAIGEARTMVIKAYLTATAALSGDTAAEKKMERWFGPKQPTIIPINQRRWWKGAQMIIGAVDDFVNKNIDVYYRGLKAPDGTSMLGKPSDYPNDGTNLEEDDLDGTAESGTGDKDNIIGLCKQFWEKTDVKKCSKMNRTGVDTVGGTLIHELSHNVCSTDDHCTVDDSKDCYGVTECEALAENKPSRAWYNADNIQYFCEDVYYGIPTGAPTRIRTGATRSVSQLKQLFGG